MSTEQHKSTFALRDDLASFLDEALATLSEDGTPDLLDVAEMLIVEGWVVDYPQGPKPSLEEAV